MSARMWKDGDEHKLSYRDTKGKLQVYVMRVALVATSNDRGSKLISIIHPDEEVNLSGGEWFVTLWISETVLGERFDVDPSGVKDN